MDEFLDRTKHLTEPKAMGVYGSTQHAAL